MKTTFANTSIRAALVLMLSSTAMPRGFQEKNGTPTNHQGSAPHATPSAPARSGGPNRTAQASRQMPAAPRSNPAVTSPTNTNRNVNINKNININKNTNLNSNALNQGSGSRQNGSKAGSGFPGRGTDVRTPQGSAFNGNSNSNNNTNVNINKNINVNRNTNSNAWNRGSDSRPGPGFDGGRGTDVRTPQRSAFNGNNNSNTNVNINKSTNINVNRNSGRGIGMVRSHEPRIEESHFRHDFGRDHQFHIDRPQTVDGRPWFQYSGVSFQAVDTWPAGWRYSDPVYVDSVGGSYFLCNPMHPGVLMPVNIADCSSCTQAPAMVANNASCTNCGAANAPADDGSVPTLVPGQTMDQVVAMLGTPKDIVDLGMRKIYLYNDMRVTFLGGRLSDVR